MDISEDISLSSCTNGNEQHRLRCHDRNALIVPSLVARLTRSSLRRGELPILVYYEDVRKPPGKVPKDR